MPVRLNGLFQSSPSRSWRPSDEGPSALLAAPRAPKRAGNPSVGDVADESVSLPVDLAISLTSLSALAPSPCADKLHRARSRHCCRNPTHQVCFRLRGEPGLTLT